MTCHARTITVAICTFLLWREFASGDPIPKKNRLELHETGDIDQSATTLATESKISDMPILELCNTALQDVSAEQYSSDATSDLAELGALYRTLGTYDKTIPDLARSLDMYERACTVKHSGLIAVLPNITDYYQSQQMIHDAEFLYKHAINISGGANGPNQTNIAQTINNIASIYVTQGRLEEGESLYLRLLDIRKKVLGIDHLDVARSLYNLAVLYMYKGLYSKAEPSLLQAIHIAKKNLKPNNPIVLHYLNELALLYESSGDHRKSVQLLQDILDVQEKLPKANQLDIVETLLNLASIFQIQRAYDKTEGLLLRALSINEKMMGTVQDSTANILIKIFSLYHAKEKNELAISFLARAADIHEQVLRTELLHLPESRKAALIAALQKETELILSLQTNDLPRDKTAVSLALTTILRRKGRIIDSSLTDKMASYLNSPPTPRIDAEYLDQDHIESEALAQTRPVTIEAVQKEIPPDAVLVEFVRVRHIGEQHFQPVKQNERYIAYTLRSHGSPRWIDLGSAATIDAELDAAISMLNDSASRHISTTILQHLYILLLTPIHEHLYGVHHIILAPDGKLNLIPFDALVDSQRDFVLEHYLISYISSGRDLLRLTTPYSPRSPAILVAAPDYGPSTSAGATNGVPFAPLLDALAEARDLTAYFPAQPLLGGAVTKSAIAALTGPGVLHIATHGFYARGRDVAHSSLRSAVVNAAWGLQRGMFIEDEAVLLPTPSSDDPNDGLDRAGLALAGANQGPAGILTAREIASFNWWGTQLVVLSACETGVGAVPTGDGVHGLRRALVLAGTASQVVSLWNVNDSATRMLMRDFYAELARGNGRAQALRQAKLQLMRQPQYTNPYYWAAFIETGDWRPLDPGLIHQHS